MSKILFDETDEANIPNAGLNQKWLFLSDTSELTTRDNVGTLELLGQDAVDAHVALLGAAHLAATASVAGFMSATDKAKLDSLVPGIPEASSISYNNTVSGLDGTNVQAAIDELEAEKEPLLNLAANEFRARASTGAAANKPISDAGLTLLAQATQTLMRTAGMGLTTVGNNMSQVATPGAVSFYQINTDGTITVNAVVAQRAALGLTAAATGVLTDATGLPLTTGVTGTLPAANGGTGQASYTIGDLLYASGATALSRLADVAVGQVLHSGGVGVAPAYSAITAGDITAALASPPAIGGTTPGVIDGTTITATTAFVAPAGSVSATAVQGPSDPNTGPVYSAADQYDIVTGGARATRVDSAQNFIVGGNVASTRYLQIGPQGTRTYSFFDNGTGVRELVLNYGITTIGNGIELERVQFGAGSAFGEIAARQLITATEDWSVGANRSSKYSLFLTNNGANSSALEIDPQAGAKFFGVTTVNASGQLRPAAGTTASPPQQFTSGPFTTSAMAGAVQYNGNHAKVTAGLLLFTQGGTSAIFTANSGNTTTTETTLRMVSLVAGGLQVTGDGIEYWEHLSVANTVATKTQKVKFGPAGSETTIFDSGAMAGATASEMILQIKIMRVSSSEVRCSVAPTLLTALSPQYIAITGLTLSNAMSLIITSQSGASGATNDTIARVGRAEFKPGI